MSYARDIASIATPIGTVRIAGDGEAVTRIAITADRAAGERPASPALIAAMEQLEAYFAGALRHFDLVLATPPTPRAAALRNGLVAVPYGECMTYGALARTLASSPRAIGQLCARNPFPIVVPCHRILAATGLGAYSAGDGPATKQWLLEHERRNGDTP